jgi:ribosome-associated protein
VIEVTDGLSVDEDEIEIRHARASGPGGQHVNKTSSAIELRFDVRRSPSLPDAVRQRLERLAGTRLTLDGVLVLFAQEHRSQELNRQAAMARLVALIRRATETPKPRKATKPTYASKLRRLQGKASRAGVKAGRAKPRLD